MKEESFLVCKNVDDLDEEAATITGSRKWDCERCGSEVWIIPRNLILKNEYKATVICVRCAVQIHQENPDEPVQLQWAKPVVDEIESKKK